MRRIAIQTLISAVIATGLWTVVPKNSHAESLPLAQRKNLQTRDQITTAKPEILSVSPPQSQLTAQLFYPPASEKPTLMISGKGSATAPADTARIELFVTGSNPAEPQPEGTVLFRGKKTNLQFAQATLVDHEDTAPLTKESLKPVTDALVAAGVSADDIDVRIEESGASSFPFSAGGAKVVAKLNKPKQEKVQKIITSATDAATKSGKIFLQSVGVQYTVNDCQSLETKAYQAAVKDAQNRAQAMASAMGVQLPAVPSIAESPFGLFFPSCNSEADLALPGLPSSTPPYNPSAPAEVQIRKDIFVTYMIP